MDRSPSGNHDRQESIVPDRPHDVRSEDSKLANNLWVTCIEALFTSFDEAEHMKSVQPNKQQEILTNFLRTAHIYKPSDGYRIRRGTHHYTFGEVISEVEGMLARLGQVSDEQAAEGTPPADTNSLGECPRTSVPLPGRTTYRFATPQGGARGQTPVWPGDDTARTHRAENIDILRVNPSGFDGGVEENNPIRILIRGAFDDYEELNPDSEVFTRGGVKMPHPEYYSGEPDLERFEVFIVGIL